MSTTYHKTQATPKLSPGALLCATRKLLLGVAVFAVATFAFAENIEVAGANPPAIAGTVADADSDPIPNATVILDGPSGTHVTATTSEDGSFAIPNLTAGTEYQIAVSADGFAAWNSSVTIGPGELKSLGEIKLRILAVQRVVTVTYSPKEVAAQQLKAEEHQRVLGFIPNIYVTYEKHPEPLTTKMKFHLAYKGLTHPTFFGLEAFWAGIQQASDMTDYRLGAQGYGERFGADLAGGASEILVGDAILPSLLHQDPRYFYQGSGNKKSRAWHAIVAPFICQGDNGKAQPNYSQLGGSLVAASLSNTYYPESNRGPHLVFTNFGTSLGLHVVVGLAQEFLLPRFTSKGVH